MLLSIFGILLVSSVRGQADDNLCDTIYAQVETMPMYLQHEKGMMEYFTSELTPLLAGCYERSNILTTSMHLTLTIDAEGTVESVAFNHIEASENCKAELRQKLLTMSGWTPGKQEGKPVCTYFDWPVSCIRWK